MTLAINDNRRRRKCGHGESLWSKISISQQTNAEALTPTLKLNDDSEIVPPSG